MADPVETLIAELRTADSWPIPRERAVHEIVARRRALRRCDRREIARMMRWDERPADDGQPRPLLVDPLPRLICRAFADFLFGEDLDINPPEGIPEDQFRRLAEVNELGAGLHRAERVCVSEGEVWAVAHINPEIADMPLLEWRSRLEVVPLFYGALPVAAAFVAERRREVAENGSEVVWRHVEVHGRGKVCNLLFRGSSASLGDEVPLDRLADTTGLRPEWEHGLPVMLAWRIVNDIDDDPTLGEGDLEQVQDQLFALNEALTIASENARLTGKDRIIASGAVTRDGTFNSGVEVLITQAESSTLGADGDARPLAVIEKSYDAEPLWRHIAELVNVAMGRVGLVPQFRGEYAGHAESGTAIRLRFLPTDNAARAKARPWDALLPRIIDSLLRVAALPADQGGFGIPYDPPEGELPAVERGDVLPIDKGERVTVNATAVHAGIRSRRSAIRDLHPDWSDEQVDEERATILEEERQLLPILDDRTRTSLRPTDDGPADDVVVDVVDEG